MATNTPQDEFHKTGVRMPKDVHARLHEAAAASGRSYNAEIVARLQSSFELDRSLPPDVQEAIQHEIEERGGTAEEAHIRVAHTAMANGGTLFHAFITPQTTIEQLKTMLEASKTIIPPDASIIVERKSQK